MDNAFLVIAAGIALLSGAFLALHGKFFPLIAFGIIVILIYMTWQRIPEPEIFKTQDTSQRQFTVFRDMESSDQTRVNPWTGFLQEDVYANRTGPIGNFEGNDDYVRDAPLYPFDPSSSLPAASFIPSCQALEHDLSNIPQSQIDSMTRKCQQDIATLGG
jgi:hypothetical protein